jgi:hypothetical protein
MDPKGKIAFRCPELHATIGLRPEMARVGDTLFAIGHRLLFAIDTERGSVLALFELPFQPRELARMGPRCGLGRLGDFRTVADDWLAVCEHAGRSGARIDSDGVPHLQRGSRFERGLMRALGDGFVIEASCGLALLRCGDVVSARWALPRLAHLGPRIGDRRLVRLDDQVDFTRGEWSALVLPPS